MDDGFLRNVGSSLEFRLVEWEATNVENVCGWVKTNPENLGQSEDFLLENLQETMETMLLLVSISP